MASNRRTRKELEGYFKKGDIPTETHFRELIGSMLNLLDDGVSLDPTTGALGLKQEDWQLVQPQSTEKGDITGEFENGWTNYGDEYSTAAFFKDSMGIVHLRGTVKGGSLYYPDGVATIFTLPEGYWPEFREAHVVFSEERQDDNVQPTIGRCNITNKGQVRAINGHNTRFSLDGITFRAASA